jgi:hypothetical protein
MNDIWNQKSYTIQYFNTHRVRWNKFWINILVKKGNMFLLTFTVSHMNLQTNVKDTWYEQCARWLFKFITPFWYIKESTYNFIYELFKTTNWDHMQWNNALVKLFVNQYGF